MTIDLNADLGEGFGVWLGPGDDASLLRHVSSANVACGFHAGDPTIMRETVGLCAAAGVTVGAHPSYPDLRGFGRVPLMLPPERVIDDVLYQVGALVGIAAAQGVAVKHVKPHGALYEAVAVDPGLARALATALTLVSDGLRLVVPASSAAAAALASGGHPHLLEGFADRAYLESGLLVPRRRSGAVLTDSGLAADQALALAQGREFSTIDGTAIALTVDTICVHSDTPGAVSIAAAVRDRLVGAGFTVAAPA